MFPIILEDIRINPILPIWLVAIICVLLLFCKRKGVLPYIRQIILIALIFVLNLRIQIPKEGIPIETEKVEAYVLFVVDDTISMVANDYDGENFYTRLDAAKSDCRYILDELQGCKSTVISFHNTAQVLTPISEDDNYTFGMINAIYPLSSLYGHGTSINVCQELVESNLKKLHEKMDGKVLIFFITDGEMNKDDALESFAKCKKYIDGGAVLGYGTESGGEMFLKDQYSGEYEQVSYYDWDKGYSEITVSEYDPDNAKRLSKDLGVTLIHREGDDDFDALEDLVEGIKEDTLSNTENGVENVYGDVYYIFALPIALLLAFEFISYKRKGSVDEESI